MGRRTRIRLGYGSIETTRSAILRVGPGFGNQSGAEIVLDRDDIARAGLAFVGQATISVVSSQQVERRTFTGLVDQVESNGDGTVTLRLRGREAVLEDQPMAGLTVFEGTDAREAVYSLLRGGGLPSNLLEGVWTPPDALRGFVVGADIAGLAVEGAREVAGVTITSHNELKSRVPDTDFARSFLDANAWAIAAVSARTLFDAEVDALRRIRTAVDALRALSAFSYPLLGGRFRAFDRGSAAAQISGPHSVLVAEASSTAGWFRSLDTPVLSGEPIDLARNMSGVAASVSEAPRAELSRALAAWRGAADARDDRDRVANLSRSMESFAELGRPDSLFDKQDLSKIRAALLNSSGAGFKWAPDQQTRLSDLVAGLNNAPLRVRFDAAITQVGAPVTRTEVEVLWKARAFRNRLEHGGDLKEPEHGIVQEAIGVLNRLLVETLIATAPDEDGVRSDSSES